MRERLQKLQNGETLRYLLKVNLQAGSAALTKGVGAPVSAVLSNGLESWWKPLQWVVAWLWFPGVEIPLLRMSL